MRALQLILLHAAGTRPAVKQGGLCDGSNSRVTRRIRSPPGMGVREDEGRGGGGGAAVRYFANSIRNGPFTVPLTILKICMLAIADP